MRNTIDNTNLRLKDAAAYLGISRPQLWRLSKNDPTFPKKIRLSVRCCMYRKADLDAWLASKEVQPYLNPSSVLSDNL